RQDELDRLAERFGAQALVADLADRADLERIADACRDMDVLVANAGLGQDSPIGSVSTAEIDQVIDVNLRAPVVLATAFAQAHLDAHTTGQIVMMGSLSGLAASPETRLYNATKFGLRGYTLALRQDLEPHRIGVTHIAPGFIRDAGMFHNGGVELPKGTRTKAPGDVAAAVIKAITHNPAEIFVSPVELRVAATFATIAPRTSERIQKRLDAAGRQRTG
ncbi:MAG: SDR family NAD(P)-dependent oxidoreductase, partial [Actinobacteria bacterium]|nr:SDR family NAD(P)-dependent oxidoreductase [Actinomycetota bacterium]